MKCKLLATLVAAATAACPNGCSGNGICGANDKCSGHGTCEYIDELAGDFYDRRTGPGQKYRTFAGTKIGSTSATPQAVPTHVTRTANTEQYHGFLYDLWDAQKIQGCKCDLGYDGPDCSHRISPKGDDPLTTVKSATTRQAFQLGDSGSADTAASYDTADAEFILIYHDPYSGVWRTDGIEGASSDDMVASNVQAALRALPNQVLDGVVVTGGLHSTTGCERAYDGVNHISGHTQEHAGWHVNAKQRENGCTLSTLTANAGSMEFTVTFADKPGQTGVQYLFEFDTNARGAGSFPVSAGIATVAGQTVVELLAAADVGTVSELSECSDRGLDNGDGECECFDGFRGLACEEQEALV